MNTETTMQDPEHECRYCGTMQKEPDHLCYKAPEFKKGDLVFTMHYSIPGIVKCEVVVPPNETNEAILVLKSIFMIGESEKVKENFSKLIDEVLFPKHVDHLFPDMRSLTKKLQP